MAAPGRGGGPDRMVPQPRGHVLEGGEPSLIHTRSFKVPRRQGCRPRAGLPWRPRRPWRLPFPAADPGPLAADGLVEERLLDGVAGEVVQAQGAHRLQGLAVADIL